ncbi:MAG: nucleotidyltransferase family protein [Desulfitobacteriaceae bacterium]
MRNVSNICIQADASLIEALEVINRDVLQIALVIRENGNLQGTVTDGDIRRAILKGLSLTTPVDEIMNKAPVTINATSRERDALFLMQAKGIHQLPVLDDQGKVLGIYVLSDLIAARVKPNTVVIMAGGLGTRLRPLTEEVPKPMLQVGDKPILHTIIEQLKDHGLTNIVLAVNYLSDRIRDYFETGEAFGVKIQYLQETERMGTAGALTLMPELPPEPLVVMNGDILTKVDFSQLLQFHQTEGHAVTMCVRNYEFRVPYGVVHLNEDYKVSVIEEKPLHSFLVSAGIYVLNPETIRMIPPKSYFDMPSLLDLAAKLPQGVGCFPIRDYWIDIGENKEYQRANSEFGRVFNGKA